MARPKKDLSTLSATLKESRKPTKIDAYLTCFDCGKTKNSADFYQSYGNINLNICHICKECVTKGCLDDEGDFDLNKFQAMLRKLDKPFLNQIYIATITKSKDDPASIVGTYMKNIHMRQYRGLTYGNSDFGKIEEVVDSSINIQAEIEKREKERKDKDKIEKATRKAGKLNAEKRIILVDKWGKYSDELLIRFEKKFDKLSKSYNLLTELHMESLIDYCRLQVLYEHNLESDNAQQAEKFKKLADESKKTGKLSVLQLDKNAMGNSVDSFGEMVRLVSKKKGVLKLPLKYVKEPADEIDYAIYQFINYERRLRGMPEIAYEDVYEWYTKDIEKFYKDRDEKVKYEPEYIE